LNNLLPIFLDQLSGTLLEENQVRSAVEGIKEVIVASTNRRIERTERARAEDFDSEEEELLREENEQEDEIFDQVSYPNTQFLTLLKGILDLFMFLIDS
jgi:hypothetical protein